MIIPRESGSRLMARVNDREVEFAEDESLNGIQAAEQVGIEIPHYCWHRSLSVVASCRMCLVEIGQVGQDGLLAMQPKLVPACQTQMKHGTVVVTDSEKVKAARNQVLEYLLLNHPLDCPTCDQAGECFLQDYSFRYGRGYSRLREPKIQRPDKDYIGEHITLFTDRCVMCTRCVRFTREVSGTGELQVINRGSHAEIDIFPEQPCDNKLAGNVVDLCPVGALCSKDFLYKQRVWWLESSNSVCPNCSTGCSIHIDQNEDTIYRLRPRPNPSAQGDFMCDEGRFGFNYIHSAQRLTEPLRPSGEGRAISDWETVLPEVRTALREAAAGGKLAAVLSPWMTVEEAYLLASFLKSLSQDVRLIMGAARLVGEDDHYPKRVDGSEEQAIRFTIRAEKCPNRRGVAEVLQRFEGRVVPLEELWPLMDSGEVESLYYAGGDPDISIDAAEVEKLKGLTLLVAEDILPSPVTDAAHYVLPGGSFAEREGTFINHAGLAQMIRRSIHSPGEARADNRILWDLTGRVGLFHAGHLRREIAREIPTLQGLEIGDLGAEGVMVGRGNGERGSAK